MLAYAFFILHALAFLHGKRAAVTKSAPLSLRVTACSDVTRRPGSDFHHNGDLQNYADPWEINAGNPGRCSGMGVCLFLEWA